MSSYRDSSSSAGGLGSVHRGSNGSNPRGSVRQATVSLLQEFSRPLPTDTSFVHDAGLNSFAQGLDSFSSFHIQSTPEGRSFRPSRTAVDVASNVRFSFEKALDEPALSESALLELNEEEGGPEATTWLQTHGGKMWQLALLASFCLVDSTRIMVDSWALRGQKNLAQPLIVMVSAVGLAGGLILSAVLGGHGGSSGKEAVQKALKPRAVLNCFPIAICFSLSQAAIARAYVLGFGAATSIVLGSLYMPECAFLSRWIFLRKYGWLETLALAMLTLSAVTFAELRNAELGLLGKNKTHDIKQATWMLSVLSTTLSCCASLFTEKLMKKKYTPEAACTPFYIQKVRLEVGGLTTAVVTLVFFSKSGLIEVQNMPGLFTDTKIYLVLFLRVLQSWMAGFLAKKLSTVSKAVATNMSLLLIYFIGDELLFVDFEKPPVWAAKVDNLTVSALALIVALVSLLYQVGRDRTVLHSPGQLTEPTVLRRASTVLASMPRRASVTLSALPHAISSSGARHRNTIMRWFLGGGTEDVMVLAAAENCAMLHSEFQDAHLHERLERRCPRFSDLGSFSMLDSIWLEQAHAANSRLAGWLSSTAGVASQVLCVGFFVIVDAGRTMTKEWFWRQPASKSISPQTVVVAGSLTSVCIGSLMSLSLDGFEGLKGALSFSDVVRCLPVAACFSLGQTSATLAFSYKLPGIVNTVLGYSYMPLSAVLTKFFFGRSYSGLEWLALVLIMLSAFVFVQLQGIGKSFLGPASSLLPAGTDTSDDEDEGGNMTIAVCFCLASVVFACVGSMAAEKLMKASSKPFYQQKVYMDLGGLLTAFVMLFVVGSIDTRSDEEKIRSNKAFVQEPAFWKDREMEDHTWAPCPPAGWGYAAIINMCVELVQAWMGGLVAKRLSSVVKSVSQAVSLLIVYFVGELLIKEVPFWWPVGTMSFVMALSVLLFSNAKTPPPASIPQDSEAAPAKEPGGGAEMTAIDTGGD